ncbi:hypothetical protein E2C01_018113 [Portunus trituberculatus]|uniref:Uncharacterized protein n=1 Tax=Portunus trituberculatus TaxID=210409 RepID=A0A5B7DUM3_PORTR|nr:hypothetical protein [Portunus trituberculatus]
MRALGSEGFPGARVLILSTVRVCEMIELTATYVTANHYSFSIKQSNKLQYLNLPNYILSHEFSVVWNSSAPTKVISDCVIAWRDGLTCATLIHLTFVVQWNHACFGVRGVCKRMGSNSVHGPSVGWGFLTLGNGFLADGL